MYVCIYVYTYTIYITGQRVYMYKRIYTLYIIGPHVYMYNIYVYYIYIYINIVGPHVSLKGRNKGHHESIALKNCNYILQKLR